MIREGEASLTEVFAAVAGRLFICECIDNAPMKLPLARNIPSNKKIYIVGFGARAYKVLSYGWVNDVRLSTLLQYDWLH